MERRNFLKTLVGLPFLGLVKKPQDKLTQKALENPVQTSGTSNDSVLFCGYFGDEATWTVPQGETWTITRLEITEINYVIGYGYKA